MAIKYDNDHYYYLSNGMSFDDIYLVTLILNWLMLMLSNENGCNVFRVIHII